MLRGGSEQRDGRFCEPAGLFTATTKTFLWTSALRTAITPVPQFVRLPVRGFEPCFGHGGRSVRRLEDEMPRRSQPRSALSGALLLLAFAAAPGGAQETRGAITGTISDKSAAVLPGVTVSGTNVETGVVTNAVSNAQGIYLLPFLPPGRYTVSAELMGFKKHVREGIEVRIADRLTLDLALEVGQLEEVVSVRAESPLLDTRSASQGQVIDERRIALLPLSDGNAFTLARLAPGVAYTGDLKFSRPFDNAGTSGIVADGASGGNEFTLDGTPNMANGRRVAFIPPAGAVSEFKVETASFDAQQGHTAGATVNVAIKSGTNNLKGEGYWYYRDDT